jgi:DNA-binding LacI/PurR family transcriptional regulator
MSVKRVSLADVAARAGVSSAAASMALLGGNGKTIKVSEATREKVRAAAAELHYVPNSSARNLARQKTGFIGYLLSDTINSGFNNAYFNRYLAGAEEACRRHGYGLYTARAALSDIHQIVFPEKLRQQSVDGLLAIGDIPDEVFNEFERYHLPTVFLNRNVTTERKYAAFCVNLPDGLLKAVEHARSMGHRRFWYCGAFSPELAVELRSKTPFGGDILVTLTDYLTGPYDEETHTQMIFERWRSTPKSQRPTLIYGEIKLVGPLLTMLAQEGVHYPEDISVMTGYDSELNNYFAPPISSVDYDFERIASDAVDTLVKYIEKGSRVPLSAARCDYPAKIIERNSVRRLS